MKAVKDKQVSLKLFLIALIGGMLLFQLNVFADALEGRIVLVNASAQSVSIQRSNPVTGLAETLSVSAPKAKFKGKVKTLADLRPGDQVKVDARKDEASGNWEAKSIEKSKSEKSKTIAERNPQKAEQEPIDREPGTVKSEGSGAPGMEAQTGESAAAQPGTGDKFGGTHDKY